jgi:hypothetical protein
LAPPLPLRILTPMNSSRLAWSLVLISAVSLTLFFTVPACSNGGGTDSDVPSTEVTLIRTRALAYFDRADPDFPRARGEMAKLVGEDALVEDLVRAAAIEMHAGEYELANAFIDRTLAQDPKNAAAFYMRGRMLSHEGLIEEAMVPYRAALAEAPDDLPTRVCLGIALDQFGEYDEAEEIFRSVVEDGFEYGGSWYVTAVYRLYMINVMKGSTDTRYKDLWEDLVRRKLKALSDKELDKGNFGVVAPPAATGTVVAALQDPPTFAAPTVILPEHAGATQLGMHDVHGYREFDVVSCGPGGLQIGTRDREGNYTNHVVTSEAVDAFLAIDISNDDDIDFITVQGGKLTLYEVEDDPEDPEDDLRWLPSLTPVPGLPSAPADIEALDFDHDGDLDILVVGAFGARLLRNDGVGVYAQGVRLDGEFVDASAVAMLPTDMALTWSVIEDYDSDNDVDFLMGGPGGLYLASSLRAGRFEDMAATRFGAGTKFEHEPFVADFDGDARPDLLASGSPATVWMQNKDNTFTSGAGGFDLQPGVPVHGVDLDLDGAIDIFQSAPDGLAQGARAAMSNKEILFSLAGDAAVGPLVFVDVDYDHDVDVVRATSAGIELHLSQGPVGLASRLQFLGKKDNWRAVGAVVEVRAQASYRRIFWRGDAILAGFGEHERVDAVRVTWPNGATQTLLDLEAGDQMVANEEAFTQAESLLASCPFLYTWNGETYEFISDVLGITPLGLPMNETMMVPPDHDEFVLVRGDQWQAKDGMLELQFTEELREVTYLDRIKVQVIDHPEGTDIYPNERFTFPPFPEAHTHTIEAPLAPIKATDDSGDDWTEELRVVDMLHAAPFEALGGQFQGMAAPHWLHLEFDPEAVKDAKKLRLICTGWFFWADASANMAAARTDGVDFIPPILYVPGPDGALVPTGPPVGFPAGKTKTMVIDVTEHMSLDDPRISIFSTLQLYWDVVHLAIDDDDAALVIHELEPQSGVLWRRGFSWPLKTEDPTLPEIFDWERMTPHSRWGQHPGLYTRYGETLPLLQAIDDQYVIMGSGDALTVQFDASGLPPVAAGHVRDYLVFFDGWAKDRDPNTIEALEVEPLPFHGMSGYPYRADEHFPDDAEHQAWRREWNTRPAFEAIVPLSPKREIEWVLER